MSDNSDRAKLESILDYVNDINKIVARHNTIENALLDFEGQYALMMCIVQIGEIVNKIKSEKYKAKLPVKNIIGFRNIITHNYDGINYHIAEQTIAENIPQLKILVEEILGESVEP